MMADPKQTTPPVQDEQPQEDTPKTNDHSILVSALKEAFTKDREIPEPKLGMDETISGGKYIKFGQLVNANGEPIDDSGNKLKRD